MEELEVWQRLQRPCVHREGDKCNDSGSKTQRCAFTDCPFLYESYDWKKFMRSEKSHRQAEVRS